MLDRNFFNNLFSFPKLFQSSFVGIDISEESIKFVELDMTKNGIRVVQYGQKEIPQGAIESGKIKNPKIVENILKTIKKEENINSARVCLPEEQVYLFTLKLDKDGLVDVKQAIEFSLEEHIPVAAQDVIFDYEIINEDLKSLHLQVAAISKSVIADYISVFENSEIETPVFELEAQALVRAVIKKGDPETYMIVDFGKRRTGVSIVSKGILMFTSTIDVGGVMLTNVIQKSFKISFEEAEKMKQNFGLGRDSENKEMFSVLLNGISVLRDEISKHMLFWQTNRDEEGKERPLIKKIILCGGDASLKGLADYLSISMKIKVSTANVWTNISDIEEYIPEINHTQSLSFSTAIGLALGGFSND